MSRAAAKATLDRFLGAVAADPETRPLSAMLAPYRALAGAPEDVVATLDLLAGMWAKAREER